MPKLPGFAAEMEKRKQLWNKKRDTPVAQTSNSWEKVSFAKDDGGAQASKFLRLMGGKNVGLKLADTAAPEEDAGITKRQQMFSQMERQYETARKATHNSKGKGLGSAGPVGSKVYFE